MARIVKGQVCAPFAFDVGYEAPLERLSAMLATTPVQPLSRTKRTPTRIQWTEPSPWQATGHFAVAGWIQATNFDSSAVDSDEAGKWRVARRSGAGRPRSLQPHPMRLPI